MPKQILVIDDHAKTRKLYRVILEQSGYSVLEAPGTLEGIRMVKSQQIDLIILDVQLPEIDGLAAARILKAYKPTRNIPIVAVTALAMPGDREEVLAAGVDRYLPKPIRRQELLQAVAYFLSGEGKIEDEQ
ncbi:MAG: response regulator [Thermoanaerobacteraceae bacterium]|jgi:two-component system cell cycle response regulator DivK|nr:response regulator [Thermoanaerobacteraceae bacterium]